MKITYKDVARYAPTTAAGILLATILIITACGENGNTLKDSRDRKTYKTVKIGKQTWMAENLNHAFEGSVCYDNDPANCDKYGRLYNWEIAKHTCPKGWHLPSKDEWEELDNYVKSSSGCIDCVGKHLKATSGWNEPGNGIDTYGFAALPGGFGNSIGNFFGAGYNGYWWSSTEGNADDAYYRLIFYYSEDADWVNSLKTGLRSVRCLQD